MFGQNEFQLFPVIMVVTVLVFMVMMMMVGLMIPPDVHDQTSGIVTHHIHELSLKTELINLILTSLSPQQQ